MRKPTKEEIKNILQFHLLTSSCAFGFVFEYSFIWFLIGLPQTSWALTITTLMGLMSAFGLIHWISKN